MIEHPYRGATAALATRHGKQAVIAPAFRDVLGMDIVVPDVDTDTFGTFAGEVPRVDTPMTTAIAKARAGLTASGLRYGIASEGSIGPDPRLPFISLDREIIVFVDVERDIVISESTRATNVVTFRASLHPGDDLHALMERADFPRHGLLVRSDENSAGLITKGIMNEADLMAAIEQCFAHGGPAIVESDLRAHCSPTRMATIATCAQLLAERIATLCPECSCPGWGRIAPARGLPCAACGTTIESAIRADRFGCPVCSATHVITRPKQHVDPQWCHMCNP